MEIEVLYDKYKPLLFTLAYQMTGITADAEDLVQDVFVKLHHVTIEKLENPKAYLCKMITNQCMDYLQSARKVREQYVGTWLPEPIIVSDDISEILANKDSLSYAMLVLMENLSPVERAIFLLKEAYAFDYRSISSMVDKSEVNCRKIFSRANEKLGVRDIPEVQPDKDWMNNVLTALKEGNVEKILPLLSVDITVYSDGGGKVPAALYPVQSTERVLRFIDGLLKLLPFSGENVRMDCISLNGDEGIIVRTDNEVIVVALFEKEGNLIKNIYFLRNPDKLGMLQNRMDLL